MFHDFQKLVERQFDKKILAVQTDWGGEYEKPNPFFQKIGIAHLVSCPHAHQQNGAAERKHRHIVEVELSLLATSSMSLKFWDEAFLAATYMINRTPSKVINFTTPLEKLFHETPDYSFLQTFGCACWPNLRPYDSRKLEWTPNAVLFSGTVIYTKAISALIYSPVEYTYLVTLCLMKISFLSLSCMLMLVLGFEPKSTSFLVTFLLFL